MASKALVDPHGRQRTVPLRLLALGLSRSGTESLCKALEMLGIPTYHGWRSLENYMQAEMWTQAVEAKYEGKSKPWTRADFDQILGDYEACTDLPCAMFAKELITAYPEAKVILNKRPIEPWYNSLINSVAAIQDSWVVWFLMNMDYQTRIIRRAWIKINGHAFEWDIKANAKRVYVEHATTVKSIAPPDRFLEYDPSQGWEPLCNFLDLSVPDCPFPTGNVSQEFHNRIEGALKPRLARSMCKAALIVAALLGLTCLGYLRYLERFYNTITRTVTAP